MWFQRRRKVGVATHNRTAKVLDSGTWTVVVHLDDRAYPGVVIQGDCLKAMKDATDRIVARARQIKDDELLRDARFLQAILHPVFDDYNETCKRNKRGGF